MEDSLTKNNFYNFYINTLARKNNYKIDSYINIEERISRYEFEKLRKKGYKELNMKSNFNIILINTNFN